MDDDQEYGRELVEGMLRAAGPLPGRALGAGTQHAYSCWAILGGRRDPTKTLGFGIKLKPDEIHDELLSEILNAKKPLKAKRGTSKHDMSNFKIIMPITE